MAEEFGWTVVQHSGYGYAGKDGFKHAIEVVHLVTKSSRNLVEKSGGVVFSTYREASDFEERANYPEGTEGLYPRVKGTFSDRTIEGLAIYIPVRDVAG